MAATAAAAAGATDVNTEEMKEKISLVSPAATAADPTCATYRVNDEDHTIGNPLRYLVMKNPEVEFCGYSIPHPSEAKLHFRVQCYPPTTALEATDKGLQDLLDITSHIKKQFKKELQAATYTTE